uniref:Arrestin domain-containing protein 3-like n=1 Tax=Gouania willdenowi TaxID=441366 RepID=A0A8C5N6D5_GOUWI
MTIKNFFIEYDAINNDNVFTNGDEIKGRIILETSKEMKIQALVFTAKGKARVVWHEHYGQNQHRVYWANEKYYEVKHHILREARQDGSEVIRQGRHVFPFTFRIPHKRIPSSFKSSIGKINHKLKAELKQSMKLTKTTKTYFTFVSKGDMDTAGLLDPQYGCKDKKVKVFGSGTMCLDVHTNKMGYQQGEVLQIMAEIKNNSNRSVKPKFTLYEKKSFLAQGHRKLNIQDILKDKAEAVEPSSSTKTMTKTITIPTELPPSILNCSIIKLEYRLKVQLDIKYSPNAEVKLPIIILPRTQATKQQEHNHHRQQQQRSQQPAAAYGFETLGASNYTTWNRAANPPTMDPPPPYEEYPLYPVIYADNL